MRTQIAKRRDGSVVLRCVRSDGSSTWQEQERQAAFFALHDLTAPPGSQRSGAKARRDELFRECFALAAGETLELGYKFAEC
jgi:hypothetical protein